MPGDAVARENARQMSNDDWQAFTTRETAKAIGAWLEARGKLQQPIHRLTMPDLEAMAGASLARFIVLASIRLAADRSDDQTLGWLLRD